jgi:hypothetical protein
MGVRLAHAHRAKECGFVEISQQDAVEIDGAEEDRAPTKKLGASRRTQAIADAIRRRLIA